MSFLTNFAQRRGCGVPGGRARAFTAKSASPPTPSIVGQSAALDRTGQGVGASTCAWACQTYFDQVNKNGGVHGRKLVLKSLDDGYEATRAAANTKTLINQEGAFALLGYDRDADVGGVEADLHRSQGPVRRCVHRRGTAARAVQPLHLQRPRELLTTRPTPS